MLLLSYTFKFPRSDPTARACLSSSVFEKLDAFWEADAKGFPDQGFKGVLLPNDFKDLLCNGDTEIQPALMQGCNYFFFPQSLYHPLLQFWPAQQALDIVYL